jgi:peptide/nickel transport system substrate-binding protein
MLKRIVLVTLILVLGSMLFIVGCGNSTQTTTSNPPTTSQNTNTPQTTTPAAEQPQSGGTLRIITMEPPSGALGLPWKASGATGSFVNSSCIEGFVKANLAGKIYPRLATNWQWSSNQLSLTLNLRHNVKFHDGSDFNAQVAKWNMEQNIAAGVPGAADISSIDIIDDYTIRVNLTAYSNVWLLELAGQGAGASLGFIISEQAYEKNGEDWAAANPVGTGPFAFKSYDLNQSMELTRFDGYWGDKPNLDGVKWSIIADQVTAEVSFQAGEGDVIWSPGAASQLLKDLVPKGFPYGETQTGLNWILVASNGNPDSPWANQLVMEAAEYAIDKQKICQTIYGGYATPEYQVATLYQNGYDPSIPKHEYDLAKAKQLLTQAGYPDGFNTTFYCGQQLNGDQIQAIQSDLAAIGIETDIQILAPGKWVDLESNGWSDGINFTPQGASAWPFYLQHYYIMPDQPSFAHQFWTTLKRPDDIESLIDKYFDISDYDQQTAAGQEINQLMCKEELVIPLWLQVDGCVEASTVHNLNFGINPEDGTPGGALFDWTGVWLSK